MMDTPHLTEDERQMLVDGSLPPEHREGLTTHLRQCRECAADVARLSLVAAGFRATYAGAPVDELWQPIRRRIEREKVVPLGAAPVIAPKARGVSLRRAALVAALAAGVVVTVIVLRPSHSVPVESVATTPDTATLRVVSDSVKHYEEEARVLLNRLELQRAMLRPEAAAAIDADLKAIDAAIAELQRAIAEDPRDPALRRLLASSFKQKVELLKRAGNAS